MNFASTLALLVVCSAAVIVNGVTGDPPTVAELIASVQATDELQGNWRRALELTLAQLMAGKKHYGK